MFRARTVSLIALLLGLFVVFLSPQQTVLGTEESANSAFVKYIYSGVINDSAPILELATHVNCYQTDPSAANVQINYTFFDSSGQTITVSRILNDREGYSVSTADISSIQEGSIQAAIGDTDVPTGGEIALSSATIDDLDTVACTAMLVDAAASPPTSMMNLPLHRVGDLGVPSAVGMSGFEVLTAGQSPLTLIALSILILLSASAHWVDRKNAN